MLSQLDHALMIRGRDRDRPEPRSAGRGALVRGEDGYGSLPGEDHGRMLTDPWPVHVEDVAAVQLGGSSFKS